LADQIRERFQIEAELVKGRDGVFEVAVDGDIIFSKRATGRFPEDGEVEKGLAARL
jgi:selT/selW/selH-like putative selenoprotein